MMDQSAFIDQLCERYPSLTVIKPAIAKACDQIIACYENGGKVLVCGNGGSTEISIEIDEFGNIEHHEVTIEHTEEILYLEDGPESDKG